MAEIECPQCCQKISMKAKKCPHCHESLVSFSTWQFILKNFNRWKSDPFFWITITSPLLIFFLNQFPLSWKISLIGGTELLLLIAFLRPFNIQMGIPIAFLSFLVSLSALYLTQKSTIEQKESFELRNRPYIQIGKDIKLEMTGRFRLNNPTKLTFQESYPEPQFKMTVSFINYGPVPASILDVSVIANKDKENLRLGEGVVFGLNRGGMEQKNVDVFPMALGKSQVLNVYGNTMKFYLGLNDIKKVFDLDLSRENIFKDVLSENIVEGTWESLLLGSIKAQNFNSYYFRIEITYIELGEQSRKRTPYKYWAIFKSPSNEISDFVFLESGLGR